MISIELNQSLLREGQKIPKALIDRIASEVTSVLKIKKTHHISVAFVSEHEIKKLNAERRGGNRVTDVLSFTLNEKELKGEIILCYPQAKRQAKERHHSTRDELTFLLVHGLLHVFGFDHEREREAKKMFQLQTSTLKCLHVDPTI